MYSLYVGTLVVLVSSAVAVSAPAQPQPPAPSGNHVAKAISTAKPLQFDGRARYYSFKRDFKAAPNTSALALGLAFHAAATTRSGFGVVAGYYSANPVADGLITPAQLETSLPGTKLNTLAEGYAHYQTSESDLRVGRQILTTPWANPADTRTIPATFEGLSYTRSLGGWTLSFDRILRYKPRTSQDFADQTLITTKSTAGFTAAGLHYDGDRASADLWHYGFADIATLDYAEYIRRFGALGVWKPSIAAQYGTESAIGRRLIGNVDARVFGTQFELSRPWADLAFGYDVVPTKPGTYQDGAFASPYTAGITGDPLYTTTIGGGLIDKIAPGRSYKLSATLYSSDRRLKAIVARARYDLATMTASPKNEAYETDVDVTYALTRAPVSKTHAQGLSLRNRLAIADTTVKPFTALQDRTILEYDW